MPNSQKADQDNDAHDNNAHHFGLFHFSPLFSDQWQIAELPADKDNQDEWDQKKYNQNHFPFLHFPLFFPWICNSDKTNETKRNIVRITSPFFIFPSKEKAMIRSIIELIIENHLAFRIRRFAQLTFGEKSSGLSFLKSNSNWAHSPFKIELEPPITQWTSITSLLLWTSNKRLGYESDNLCLM